MVARRNAAAASTADVRAQALAAATRRFASQGFDATSLQAVADDVGVAKQSLLHYFPSKDALREAVLAQMLAHWNEQLPRILLAVTGEDRFEAVSRELVAFFLADPDRARLVLREALDRPAETRELLAAHVRPWVAAIASYIRKGQKHGEHYADADPEAYLLAVLHMVITGVAAGGIAAAVLHPDGSGSGSGSDGAARHRLVREVLRLARTGLFSPAAAAGFPTTTPARKTPRRAKPAR